jgi:hypothetical protein
METLEHRIEEAERQVQINRRLIVLAVLVLVILTAFTGALYSKLWPLPLDRELRLTAKDGKNVLLAANRLRFASAQGVPLAEIDVTKELAPQLSLSNSRAQAVIRTIAADGAEMKLKSGTTNPCRVLGSLSGILTI